MDYSTQHAATLALLEEALDLLNRMPSAPLTRQFCRKLQAHLDEPINVLLQQEMSLKIGGSVREGGFFTEAGLPMYQAHLVEPGGLVVWAPKPASSIMLDKLTRRLMRSVFSGGAKIRLVPRGEWHGPKYGGRARRAG